MIATCTSILTLHSWALGSNSKKINVLRRKAVIRVYIVPGEQNSDIVVERVLVPFHVEFLLPLTEAV